MRIVVAYVKAVEKVDVRSLTNVQRECYSNTLQVSQAGVSTYVAFDSDVSI